MGIFDISKGDRITPLQGKSPAQSEDNVSILLRSIRITDWKAQCIFIRNGWFIFSRILLSTMICSTLLSYFIISFLRTFIAYIYPLILCLTCSTLENPPFPITFSISKHSRVAGISPLSIFRFNYLAISF